VPDHLQHTSSAPRIRELDVLRGVAVVLVLGRHMPAVPLDAPFAAQTVFDLWLRVGWIGVDLFFVLSGFLVSGLLFREYGRLGEVHVGRFLARRGLRIYPAFYAFLLVTSIATGTLGTRHFFAEAAFVQNYVPGLWDHTWSLAIEEHFYLLLALLIFALARRNGERRQEARMDARHASDPFATLIPIFAIVALAEIALRILTAQYGKPSFVHHLYPTHLRLDSLLFGVLLAYLAWSRGNALAVWVREARSPLVLIAVLCLAPACFLPAIDPFMETVGFSLLYIGFGATLLLALYGGGPVLVHPAGSATWAADAGVAPTRRITVDGAGGGVVRPSHFPLNRMVGTIRRAAASVLAWIGVYSYSIYLWHLAVKRWGVPPIVHAMGWQPNGLAAFGVYAVGSLLVGAGLARLIEIPTLAVRERWLPASAASQVEQQRQAA
jgi:peptidoglycan/LPS O-acetylase OafA/YrhL